MSVVSMRELLEAGVHFGHQTRRWNPKMRRFIFTERGGIYIIDLQQTLQLLEDAHAFARNLAERGGAMLFVGTKKQSQGAVEEQAASTQEMSGNIAGVSAAAQETGVLAEAVRAISEQLAGHSTGLGESMQRFLKAG